MLLGIDQASPSDHSAGKVLSNSPRALNTPTYADTNENLNFYIVY